MEEALQRPHSQLKLSLDARLPAAGPFPNTATFRAAAHNYANLCQVHLLMGDADAAFRDLWGLRRLADAVQANEPPSLFGAMTKTTIVGLYARVVQDTLAEGLWPATHLERVQKLNEGMDLLRDYTLSVRGGERAFGIGWVETSAKEDKGHFLMIQIFYEWRGERRSKAPQWAMRLAVPDGWIDQNLANYARLMQFMLAGMDVSNQRMDAPMVAASFRNFENELYAGIKSHPSYYRLSAWAIPDFTKAFTTVATEQTLINQAFLACALERHRAAKGGYPGTLAALVPEFAAKLPHDLFDGQPLRYRRTDDGKYLLYSIGWNSKDDGGTPALDKNGKPSSEWSKEHGDWLWRSVSAK